MDTILKGQFWGIHSIQQYENMIGSMNVLISKVLDTEKIIYKSDKIVTKIGENWAPSWKISPKMTKMWQPEKIIENMTKMWQIRVCHIFPEKNVTNAFKIWPISGFCHKMWQTEHPVEIRKFAVTNRNTLSHHIPKLKQ